jgi:transposase InsO family protein
VARSQRTTLPDKALPCPLDKVNRQFHAPAPNVLWVSDFTYVNEGRHDGMPMMLCVTRELTLMSIMLAEFP